MEGASDVMVGAAGAAKGMMVGAAGAAKGAMMGAAGAAKGAAKVSLAPSEYVSNLIRQSSLSLALGVFLGSALTSGIAFGLAAAWVANRKVLLRLQSKAVEIASEARDQVLSTREGQALQRVLLAAPAAVASLAPTDDTGEGADASTSSRGTGAGAGASAGAGGLAATTTSHVKTLLLVRAAESAADAAAHQGATDAFPRDPPLSARGRQQAAEAKEALMTALATAELGRGGVGGWLLASSPLTRALETAAGMCESTASVSRRAVVAELRAFLIDCDDSGTPRSELERRWPALRPALSELPEIWWSTKLSSTPAEPPGRAEQPEATRGVGRARRDQRTDAFLAWVARQPESKVVVVAHRPLLQLLTAHLGLGCPIGGEGWGFPNAGVLPAVNVDLAAYAPAVL